MNEKRDWIVITGHPIDTEEGGGFEYDGPFTETEAQAYRDYLKEVCKGQEFDTVIIQVQLLGRGRRWLDAHKKEGSP
jgi:hypothetical protein